MITRKREMAEWILGFFRRSQTDAGQVIMMRALQNKLLELNPKERHLFAPVFNELIEHGYFTYEEGASQSLRLTSKGKVFISNPNAVLDCCFEKPKYSQTQEKYLEWWHNSFVSYIVQLKDFIDNLMLLPDINDEDRHGLVQCRLLLDGKSVADIVNQLSQGIITREVLDEIEKLDKELVDIIVKNIRTDTLVREFLRQMAYLRIEESKKGAEQGLRTMAIPVN